MTLWLMTLRIMEFGRNNGLFGSVLFKKFGVAAKKTHETVCYQIEFNQIDALKKIFTNIGYKKMITSIECSTS